jgi:hypothetical protein
MSTLPTRTDISGAPSNATARTALTAIYDMIAQRLAAGTSGAGAATDAELKLARESLQVPHRNYIDNPIGPAGIVYQRTVAATADDAYFADRWYALTQTSTVTPSIITAPEAGFASGLRVTQSQATAQRYGFAQILPADYVNELVSGNASCSFRARISNTTTLRFALLGWTGTADTVISDVVNDWTSTNYSTGNFFITGGGSLSVIATGSQAMTANTFATLSINAAAIPANVKNLILFCWTDTTQAQNSTLDFHDVRLTKTDVRVPVLTRSLSDEESICQSWAVLFGNAAPGPISTIARGYSTGTAAGWRMMVNLPKKMRRPVTLSFSNLIGWAPTAPATTFLSIGTVYQTNNTLEFDGTFANNTQSNGLPFDLQTNNTGTSWLLVSSDL